MAVRGAGGVIAAGGRGLSLRAGLSALRRILTLAAAAGLVAGQARAHAFQGGADGYAQFVEGAGVILTYPGILLPILALGVAVSLWDTEGLPRVWPHALAGQVLGIFAASVGGGLGWPRPSWRLVLWSPCWRRFGLSATGG